jgi:hypothetical protein
LIDARAVDVFRIRLKRQKDLWTRLELLAVERCAHDSENAVRRTSQRNRLPDGCGIAIEAAQPQAGTQDRDGGTVGPILVDRECPARDDRCAE